MLSGFTHRFALQRNSSEASPVGEAETLRWR